MQPKITLQQLSISFIVKTDRDTCGWHGEQVIGHLGLSPALLLTVFGE